MSNHLEVTSKPSGDQTVNRPKPSTLGSGAAAGAAKKIMTRKERIEKALRDAGA